MIALEPEAASLYCMHQPVLMDSENSTHGVFKSGSKFMVVEAGGNVDPFLKISLKINLRTFNHNLTMCSCSKTFT